MVLRPLSNGRAACTALFRPELAGCRRLASRHFAVEVAPAVKVLGIPEAATWSPSSSSRGSPLLEPWRPWRCVSVLDMEVNGVPHRFSVLLYSPTDYTYP
eukprot:s185_g35.t1